MEVRAPRTRATYGIGLKIANVNPRLLEYLCIWEQRRHLTPALLESWEINDDATNIFERAAKGVSGIRRHGLYRRRTWARNITGWCDNSVEGKFDGGPLCHPYRRGKPVRRSRGPLKGGR